MPHRTPPTLTLLRQRAAPVATLASLGLSGCSAAPLQNVLGSFFPSWMLCAAIGATAAAALRAALGALGLETIVPAPMLTYLAFATAVTFAIWLLFFGH